MILFTAQCITGTILFFAAICLDPSNKIQTEPVLVENTLAKNFNGIKLSVKFQLIRNFYFWTHPGLTLSQTTIYNPILHTACRNKSENAFRVTCQEVLCGKSTYIISSLTLMFSLNTNVTFAVYQHNGPLTVKVASIDVRVKGKLINIWKKITNKNYL